MDQATFRQLVTAGVWAPSAENRHHIRFADRGDHIALLPDAVLRAESEGRKPLHWLAIGAVVENMAVAAAALGLAIRVAWAPASEDGACAHVVLDPNGQPDTALARLNPALFERCTNRTPFFGGKPLSDEKRAALGSPGIAGCHLVWMRAPAQKKILRGIAWEAESQRFAEPILHHELFSDICFPGGWTRVADEGLSLGALGIELPARPFFALMRHWPVARALSRVGLHRAFAWRAAALPLQACPELCVVAMDGDSAEDYFKAGRLMERLWLQATLEGLAVQPFAASVLYTRDGYPGVGAAVCERMRVGWQGLLGAQQPAMVLRMGRAAMPALRAGRPPIDQFLVTS